MAQSALSQLIMKTQWDNVDILVVDLPPGTGDVVLTLTQQVDMAGAVVVSTPQEVALDDVRRAVAMFHKMNVPILGMVSNMAWLVAGGEKVFPFGSSKALQDRAHDMDVPFWGEVPLESLVGETGDKGVPLTAHGTPNSPAKEAFECIALKVKEALLGGLL